MTGVNALVEIETFKRSDVSIPAGCIMKPMLATDVKMWVVCFNSSVAFIASV